MVFPTGDLPASGDIAESLQCLGVVFAIAGDHFADTAADNVFMYASTLCKSGVGLDIFIIDGAPAIKDDAAKHDAVERVFKQCLVAHLALVQGFGVCDELPELRFAFSQQLHGTCEVPGGKQGEHADNGRYRCCGHGLCRSGDQQALRDTYRYAKPCYVGANKCGDGGFAIQIDVFEYAGIMNRQLPEHALRHFLANIFFRVSGPCNNDSASIKNVRSPFIRESLREKNAPEVVAVEHRR